MTHTHMGHAHIHGSIRWRGKWQPQVDEDSIPYQMEVDHTEKTVYTDDVPSFSTVNGQVE